MASERQLFRIFVSKVAIPLAAHFWTLRLARRNLEVRSLADLLTTHAS
jgi:hypothetical protein